MKTYYVFEMGKQTGPFTIEELATRHITASTPVWSDEMPSWQNAGTVPELQSIIQKSPPPYFKTASDTTAATHYQSDNLTEKSGFKIGKRFGWSGFFVVTVLVILTIFFINTSNQTKAAKYPSAEVNYIERPKTPEELKEELLQSERNEPHKFIHLSYRQWENLINERVVEAVFRNNASVAMYKDMTVQVGFLTETKKVLQLKEYTVHKYLPTNGEIKYKMKFSQPSGTNSVAVRLVRAEAE